MNDPSTQTTAIPCACSSCVLKALAWVVELTNDLAVALGNGKEKEFDDDAFSDAAYLLARDAPGHRAVLTASLHEHSMEVAMKTLRITMPSGTRRAVRKCRRAARGTKLGKVA